MWGLAAMLIHWPGRARWVGVGLVLCVSAGWVVIAVRRGRTRRPTARVTLRRPLVGTALLWCALLVLLCARITTLEHARDTGGEALNDVLAASEAVTVTLSGFPAVTTGMDGGERGWVRGRANAVPVMLWLPEAAPHGWALGTQIEVSGSAMRGPPASRSAYEIRVRSFHEVRPDHPTAAQRAGAFAADLRVGLTRAAASAPGAALVPGFAVGETSLVTEALELKLQDASLTHLIAVSGSNCALLTGAALWVSSRLGVGRRGRQVLAAACLGGFVLVVGPDASVQRAAVMATVVLVSGFGGKRAQALPALGLAVVVLVLGDPWQAMQAGFALSVVATGGIVLWGAPVASWLQVHARFPRWVALPVSVALVAQLACAPLLLLLQPGLPAAGVLANLIAAPAAPMGTAIGLVALVLLPLHRGLGGAAVWLAAWAGRWVEAAADVSVALPGARWHWPGGVAGALTLLFVIGLLAWAYAVSAGVIRFRTRRPPQQQPGRPGTALPWRASSTTMDTQARGARVFAGLSVGIGAGIFAALVIVVPVTTRIGVPDDWFVVACDIGQGDAFLLRDPESPSEVMLIDTGDDAVGLDRCLKTFGVRRVSTLVLTHDDRDHVGAMPRVLDRVDSALIAAPTVEQRDSRPVEDMLSAAGVPFEIGSTGMRGGVGVTWEVLAPDATVPQSEANAVSLVIRATVSGVSILFLGDTGEREQRTLSSEYPDLTADIVKLAHHGSKDQFVEFYLDLGSLATLVSVGENRYGHPNPGVLKSIQASGSVILRTDELGSVAMSVRDGRLERWATGSRFGESVRGTG